MVAIDITLERWDSLSEPDKEALARRIGRELPHGFVFAGLERHALGGVAHTVAFFRRGELGFALVPGGEIVLGCERGAVALTDEQRASWDETEEEYEMDFDRFIDLTMSARRSVVLAPFLIGVEPVTLGMAPFDAPPAPPGIADVQPDRLHRKEWMTHAQVRSAIEADGFAMPTDDEWEHACRAGSETLFRWGDACPADCYPDEPSDFDLHLKRNAFGLSIGQNPYAWEACDQPGAMRGGDGGSAICGGAGFVAGWMPLASAYRHDVDPTRPLLTPRTRRVLRLA